MKAFFTRLHRALHEPVPGAFRLALLIGCVFLAFVFTQPLWRISMTAPQYPEGLEVEIYVHKLVGGNDGQHIEEINTLNHYIGMRPLTEDAMVDLDWMPFAFGILILLALRVVTIGNVRAMVDLLAVTVYVSLFAFARFYMQLYAFGHDLDPQAPVTVEPFMPAVFGTKQIANFHTASWPAFGSICMFLFVAILSVATIATVRSAWRKTVAVTPQPETPTDRAV